MEFQHSTIETYLHQWLGRPVTLEALQQLGTESTGAAALKAFGYGQPLLIDYRDGDEQNRDEQNPNEQRDGESEHDKLHRVVLRRVKRSGFGHERDADCMAEIWLSFNTFNHMQHHVAALDLAGVTADNRLTSLGALQELLLVTAYAPGQPYAEDLLRIRNDGVCTAQDLRRAQALATYLADLHRVKHDDPLTSFKDSAATISPSCAGTDATPSESSSGLSTTKVLCTLLHACDSLSGADTISVVVTAITVCVALSAFGSTCEDAGRVSLLESLAPVVIVSILGSPTFTSVTSTLVCAVSSVTPRIGASPTIPTWAISNAVPETISSSSTALLSVFAFIPILLFTVGGSGSVILTNDAIRTGSAVFGLFSSLPDTVFVVVAASSSSGL